MIGLNGSAEHLQEAECEIGGTRFFFAKLPALEAWDLLERIRHEIGKTASATAPGAISDETGISLLQLVLSLDPAFVRDVRDTLFERVSYANVSAVTPQPLAKAESMAFADLEPVAVYEVLARALAVNFLPSAQALGSTLRGLDQTSIPSAPSASTESSPA